MKIALGQLGTEALDPILTGQSGKGFMLPMYDYLVGVNWDGSDISPESGIANKWEASADKKVWTFYLRQGVKFHNGEEITADDVKFTLDRAGSPQSVSGNASTFKSAVESVEAASKYQVIVRLKKPSFLFPYLVSGLMMTEGMVVPKKYIEEKGMPYFNAHPIGSGPYKMAEHVSGSYVKYEALDEHWYTGVPKYKFVTFNIVPEESTRLALLKKGDADIISISRDSVADAKAGGFNIVGAGNDQSGGLYIHQQWRDGPFKDSRVRQALTLAINRQELLDTLMHGTGQLTGIMNEYSWAIGVQPTQAPPFDPDQARRLLADAGYAKGLKVYMYTYPRAELPEASAIALAIAGYWKAVAIDTEMITMDYGAFRTKWSKDDLLYPSVNGPVGSGNRPIADSTYATLFRSNSTLKTIQDPKFDKLLDDVAAQTADEKGYAAALGAVRKALQDEAITIPLFEFGAAFAAKKGLDWKPAARSASDFNWKQLYTRR